MSKLNPNLKSTSKFTYEGAEKKIPLMDETDSRKHSRI